MYRMLEKSLARVNLMQAKENYNFLKTQVSWQVSDSTSPRVCSKDHPERSKHRKPRLHPRPVKNENVKRRDDLGSCHFTRAQVIFIVGPERAWSILPWAAQWPRSRQPGWEGYTKGAGRTPQGRLQRVPEGRGHCLSGAWNVSQAGASPSRAVEPAPRAEIRRWQHSALSAKSEATPESSQGPRALPSTIPDVPRPRASRARAPATGGRTDLRWSPGSPW